MGVCSSSENEVLFVDDEEKQKNAITMPAPKMPFQIPNNTEEVRYSHTIASPTRVVYLSAFSYFFIFFVFPFFFFFHFLFILFRLFDVNGLLTGSVLSVFQLLFSFFIHLLFCLYLNVSICCVYVVNLNSRMSTTTQLPSLTIFSIITIIIMTASPPIVPLLHLLLISPPSLYPTSSSAPTTPLSPMLPLMTDEWKEQKGEQKQ